MGAGEEPFRAQAEGWPLSPGPAGALGSPQPLPCPCRLVPSAARGSDCPGPSQTVEARDAFSWLPSPVWSRDPPLDGSKTCGKSRAQARGAERGLPLRASPSGYGPSAGAGCRPLAAGACPTDLQLKTQDSRAGLTCRDKSASSSDCRKTGTGFNPVLTPSWALGWLPGSSASGAFLLLSCLHLSLP